MSETNPQRIMPVYDAAVALEADRSSTAKRDALFAAVTTSKARRFYVTQNNLFLVINGVERRVAQFENPDVADMIKTQLNADLAGGWVPNLNP